MTYRKSIIKSLWMLGAGIILIGNIASAMPKRPLPDDGDGTDIPPVVRRLGQDIPLRAQTEQSQTSMPHFS